MRTVVPPHLTPITFVRLNKKSVGSNIPVMMMNAQSSSMANLSAVNQDLTSVRSLEKKTRSSQQRTQMSFKNYDVMQNPYTAADNSIALPQIKKKKHSKMNIKNRSRSI